MIKPQKTVLTSTEYSGSIYKVPHFLENARHDNMGLIASNENRIHQLLAYNEI